MQEHLVTLENKNFLCILWYFFQRLWTTNTSLVSTALGCKWYPETQAHFQRKT